MLLRSILTEVNGFRHLVDVMQLQSGPGKRYLLDTAMLHDAMSIEAELNLVERVYDILGNNNHAELVTKIQTKLMQVKDIRGSVKNIAGNLVLDDIELFEIKCFALVSQQIFELQKEYGISLQEIPGLQSIVSILDPQNTKIPSFYIYDNYSEELAAARKELKQLKASLNGKQNADVQQQVENLFQRAQEIEAEIREEICQKLNNSVADLENALINIAHLDVLIAKAILAKDYNLNRGGVSDGSTEYTSMFNPLIAERLAEQNRKFQPVDICIDASVCFITGANMAGKTVILKTLALCQYLMQFGFFVPAAKAKISLVDRIMISVGDEQSEQNGLSSFASEMIKINDMVEASQRSGNVLILIDELARTTNPVEGRAIVNAVADIFYGNSTKSVITTHYGGLNAHCRKLRVKGLDKDIKAGIITKDNINDYIDYSLVEDHAGDVPHEALRIASMLGINGEIIEKAQNQLDKAEQINKEIIK